METKTIKCKLNGGLIRLLNDNHCPGQLQKLMPCEFIAQLTMFAVI